MPICMPFVGKYVMYDSRCAGIAKWFQPKRWELRANGQSFKPWGIPKECGILSKGASEAANNQIESEREKRSRKRRRAGGLLRKQSSPSIIILLFQRRMMGVN